LANGKIQVVGCFLGIYAIALGNDDLVTALALPAPSGGDVFVQALLSRLKDTRANLNNPEAVGLRLYWTRKERPHQRVAPQSGHIS
jgi:hypothetical protein